MDPGRVSSILPLTQYCRLKIAREGFLRHPCQPEVLLYRRSLLDLLFRPGGCRSENLGLDSPGTGFWVTRIEINTVMPFIGINRLFS